MDAFPSPVRLETTAPRRRKRTRRGVSATSVAVAAIGTLLTGCTDAPPVAPDGAPLLEAKAKGASGPQVVTGVTGPGSLYALHRPDPWNGAIVLYAHGYVTPESPVALPVIDPLRDALLGLGYGVAYSSYPANGFALKEGAQRTHQLRGLFTSHLGRPERTYLMGHSLGGMVALMLAERHPAQYDGALVMCSFPGGSRLELDYIFDVRVLFDAFFPGVLPGNAVQVPPQLKGPGFSTVVIPAVVGALLANPGAAVAMAGVDQVDIQWAAFDELVTSVLNVLFLQIHGAEDLAGRTHGHPFFDNTATAYSGSPDDVWLNAAVKRYAATPDAQAYLGRYYEPDGRLGVPVLTLHTTRDPVTPFAHEGVYAATVDAAGRADLLVQRAVDRFGHCALSNPEHIVSFLDLVAWAEQGVIPAPWPAP